MNISSLASTKITVVPYGHKVVLFIISVAYPDMVVYSIGAVA